MLCGLARRDRGLITLSVSASVILTEVKRTELG